MGLTPLTETLSDLFASMPFLGSIPAWITAGSMSTFLGLYWRHQRGLKQIGVEAERVRIESRKVDQSAEADMRDHYADEVKQMREALKAQSLRHSELLTQQDKRHNDALTALEDRHGRAMLANEERQAKCEQERERLAEKVSDLQQKLMGVMDQVRMNSAEQVVLLADSGEPVPPHAVAAARRIVERNS